MDVSVLSGLVSGRVRMQWMHQNGRGINLATLVFQVKIMTFGDFQEILENASILPPPGPSMVARHRSLLRRRRSSRGAGIGSRSDVAASETGDMSRNVATDVWASFLHHRGAQLEFLKNVENCLIF